MLKNYFKIAWRNLTKNKLYSTINVVGLAIAIASCILIGLYVYQQFRYDRFHKNSDRIYRVLVQFSGKNQSAKYAMSPKPLGPFLEKHFPGVEQAVRLMKPVGDVRVGHKLFSQKFLVAEQGFFKYLILNC